MAQLPTSFDANQIDPEPQFSPVPNGDYAVIITESEMKTTKDGNGQYLQLVLEIIDGHYKGRKIWDRLNIVNQNQVAKEIAQRALSQICHAVGILNLSDSVELHQKPLVAKIVIKPASGGYDESNEVKEYKAYSSTGSQQSTAAPPASQPPAPAAPNAAAKPAWA